MKQTIIVLAFAAAAIIAAVIISATGALDGILNRDPNQLSEKEVRALYEEEIDEYRAARDVRLRAEEADPRDPFAREILRDAGEEGTFIAEALAEGEPVCTQEDLDQWTGELVPIIERITGWKLEQQPEVKLADRAGIVDSVARDTNRILHGGLDNTFEAQRRYAALQSAFLLGHCGLHSEEVFVVASNFRPLFRGRTLSDEDFRGLAKLVLAHELAHVFQSRYSPLLNQFMSDDVYEVATVHAAFEGHATLIAELVAADLGLQRLSRTLHRAISDQSTCFGFGGVGEFVEGVAAEDAFSFGVARDFMAHHLAAGGHERLREIIMSPPRQRSSIIDPPQWENEARQLPTVLISTAVTDFITAAGFERIDDQPSINRAYEETIQRLDQTGQEVIRRTKDGAPMGIFTPADKRGVLMIFAHRFRDPDDALAWHSSATGFVERLSAFCEGREDMAVEDARDEPLPGLDEIVARRIRHIQFIRGRGRGSFDESFSVIDRMGVQLFVQGREVDEEFHRRIHDEMWKYYRLAVLGEDTATAND